MERDEYKVGVEFEMDAIEAGQNADFQLKHYLNTEKTCYFEFDGNKTLEFVTNPYKWSNETSASEALLKDLLLAEVNIRKLYQGNNAELIEAASKDKGEGEGESLTINSIWPLGVPQITFQIPMHQFANLRDLAKRILKSEKAKACFDFPIPNIASFGTDTDKADLEIKGLAYLCVVTIKSLQTMKLASREVGPKGCLAFMSRLSFRSMYLGLAQPQREKFNSYIETVFQFTHINKKDKLFQDYTTSFGVKLSDSRKSGFTVEDFINSMTKDNYDYSWETPSFDMDMLNIVFDGDADSKIIYPQRNSNTTDLLSPPPFMAEDYSMGALKELKLSKHFVLEFRAAAGSIFYAEETNDQRWVLSSSAEEKETTVFFFYHSMIQTFEELFMHNTALKKIESWEIKHLQEVFPYINRNHLWRCVVKIARSRLYTGGHEIIVIEAILTLIAAFQTISKDIIRANFGEIFESFDDDSYYNQVKNMNGNHRESFCSIATTLLLKYDRFLSEFKKKDNK